MCVNDSGLRARVHSDFFITYKLGSSTGPNSVHVACSGPEFGSCTIILYSTGSSSGRDIDSRYGSVTEVGNAITVPFLERVVALALIVIMNLVLILTLVRILGQIHVLFFIIDLILDLVQVWAY